MAIPVGRRRRPTSRTDAVMIYVSGQLQQRVEAGQQRLLHPLESYPAERLRGGSCGPSSSPTISARRWPRDLTCRRMRQGQSVTLEAAVGYTSARYVADSAHNLAFDGDAISGQAAINASPGTNPPWNVSVGAQYNFVLAEHKSYARFDYEFESRNPWPAAVQDPRSNEYAGGVGGGTTPLSYTLPSTSFLQFRTGMTFGAWQASFFIDNLLNSQTTTNYESNLLDSNNPPNIPLGRRQHVTTVPSGHAPSALRRRSTNSRVRRKSQYRRVDQLLTALQARRPACGTPAAPRRPPWRRSCPARARVFLKAHAERHEGPVVPPHRPLAMVREPPHAEVEQLR